MKITQAPKQGCRALEPLPSPTRFFAVAQNGTLRPLDAVRLAPGSHYLVEIHGVPSVPVNRALRRILARGGPSDLPADFAERHGHYAHGARR
jgi:hypothetical protein